VSWLAGWGLGGVVEFWFLLLSSAVSVSFSVYVFSVS
jgi:hypothetical protein